MKWNYQHIVQKTGRWWKLTFIMTLPQTPLFLLPKQIKLTQIQNCYFTTVWKMQSFKWANSYMRFGEKQNQHPVPVPWLKNIWWEAERWQLFSGACHTSLLCSSYKTLLKKGKMPSYGFSLFFRKWNLVKWTDLAPLGSSSPSVQRRSSLYVLHRKDIEIRQHWMSHSSNYNKKTVMSLEPSTKQWIVSFWFLSVSIKDFLLKHEQFNWTATCPHDCFTAGPALQG